jgi:hypothetical protein
LFPRSTQINEKDGSVSAKDFWNRSISPFRSFFPSSIPIQCSHHWQIQVDRWSSFINSIFENEVMNVSIATPSSIFPCHSTPYHSETNVQGLCSLAKCNTDMITSFRIRFLIPLIEHDVDSVPQ